MRRGLVLCAGILNMCSDTSRDTCFGCHLAAPQSCAKRNAFSLQWLQHGHRKPWPTQRIGHAAPVPRSAMVSDRLGHVWVTHKVSCCLVLTHRCATRAQSGMEAGGDIVARATAPTTTASRSVSARWLHARPCEEVSHRQLVLYIATCNVACRLEYRTRPRTQSTLLALRVV